MKQPFDLSLYLITDPALAGQRGMLETVRAAIAAGVTLVQLRDPQGPTRRLVEEARVLKALLDPQGIPLIVNDRVDVALAADAAGVHVGQGDMKAGDVRSLIGPDRILGLSVANEAELKASELDLAAVDYLGVGPIFATSTKDAGPAIGTTGLRWMAENVKHRLVAIGGIKAEHAGACIGAGAEGVAVVSAIMAAADPTAAARELAEAVSSAKK